MGLIQGLINIIWPSHLFMPEDAVRFKDYLSGTIPGGGWGDQPVFNWTVPLKHKAVINWIYLSLSETTLWRLKVNNQPDSEYGSITGNGMTLTTDPWLIPLQNARVVLKAQDKVILYLTGLATNPYSWLIRGYYWPE